MLVGPENTSDSPVLSNFKLVTNQWLSKEAGQRLGRWLRGLRALAVQEWRPEHPYKISSIYVISWTWLDMLVGSLEGAETNWAWVFVDWWAILANGKLQLRDTQGNKEKRGRGRPLIAYCLIHTSIHTDTQAYPPHTQRERYSLPSGNEEFLHKSPAVYLYCWNLKWIIFCTFHLFPFLISTLKNKT